MFLVVGRMLKKRKLKHSWHKKKSPKGSQENDILICKYDESRQDKMLFTNQSIYGIVHSIDLLKNNFFPFKLQKTSFISVVEILKNLKRFFRKIFQIIKNIINILRITTTLILSLDNSQTNQWKDDNSAQWLIIYW